MSKDEHPTGMRLMDRPSRPRASERKTRSKAILWDRVRFLILLGILWLAGLAVIWSTTVKPLAGPFSDAIRLAVNDYAWILILMAFELLRQIHYFIEEHSAGYYRFWEEEVFGGLNRGVGKLNPYTRYRLVRALKMFVVLLVLSTLLGRIFNSDPVWLGIVEAPARLVASLPFLLQIMFTFFLLIGQFVALFWFLSRGGVDTIMPDEIETRFDDVKGQDSALGQLKETLVFLEDPEAIESRGGYVPGGILLWGPPGTGKTLMAQAIAGETGRPFVAVEPSAFMNMFIGVGPLKVKGLYRKLRRLALRYGGVIVFFDEADSLGSRGGAVAGANLAPTPWTTAPSCNGLAYLSSSGRNATFASAPMPAPSGGHTDRIIMGGMGGGGGMGTLQILLSEMSGLTKPRGLINRVRKMLGMKPKPPPKYRILHIFATNMRDTLDPAMLRPGRVDRQYKVGYPQKDGRKATFEYYLKKVKNDLDDAEVDRLATITPYFSGADIKDIVNEGLVIAIREDRDTVFYADVVKAKQMKQHGLPDDHEFIERERHSVAVHEACHAITAYRLRRHEVIDMATIERRGDIGGFVSSIPPEDQFVNWRSERETDVMTSLASLAGERLFFDGDHSMGVGGDMRAATAVTTQALAYYAMGETIASRSVTLAAMRGDQSIETGADRAMFDSEFGRKVEDRLQALYDDTWALLEENRPEVLSIAHALETEKTITGDDIEAIVEGRRGPTVDGRPYHDTGFRQMLERYHEAVLRAHKAHSGVESRIPVPVPPPPVDLGIVDGSAAGNGQTAVPRAGLNRPSPPRPDSA